MKTDEDVSANQRSRARAMRGAPTDAELRLWRLLRDRRLNGFKFRRQVPVGRYIVDFLCVGSRLIVEADGSQHAESRHDEVRDAYLASQGWKRSRESVLETILAHAEHPRDANPHPAGSAVHLLPEGEGVERTAAPESLPPEGEGGAPKARRMRVKQTEGSEDRYA
jgi:very-short-patch-repair endonuclease